MAKSLGAAVIELLEHERVELRVAAATVLAVVGKGDQAVEAGLTKRLADPDIVVARLALTGWRRWQRRELLRSWCRCCTAMTSH